MDLSNITWSSLRYTADEISRHSLPVIVRQRIISPHRQAELGPDLPCQLMRVGGVVRQIRVIAFDVNNQVFSLPLCRQDLIFKIRHGRSRLLDFAKYKTLEKLVNATQLPALVEQKPVNRQPDETHAVHVFEPLTLTEKIEQTFLVVNCINDGIIDGDFIYVPVNSTEGKTFQVANMNTPELVELMNMYNRSCSHIDFDKLVGPLDVKEPRVRRVREEDSNSNAVGGGRPDGDMTSHMTSQMTSQTGRHTSTGPVSRTQSLRSGLLAFLNATKNKKSSTNRHEVSEDQVVVPTPRYSKIAPGDPRHPGHDSTSYHNHDDDVTAADAAGRPVAPRRTKRDRHQQGTLTGRHDDDDDVQFERSDERRASMTNVLPSDTDENDNVLLPAAETDDVTESEITTDNDGSLHYSEDDNAPNTTSWRASVDRRHAAAAAAATTTDDDDDDIAASSQSTLAAADTGGHNESNLATMRPVTHSAGYLPGSTTYSDQSQQEGSRPADEHHRAEFVAELPTLESTHQQALQRINTGSQMRGASSLDTIAKVSVTHQYGSLVGQNSRTVWSSNTHQRTLHMIQPMIATPTRSSDARVVSEQLNVVEPSKQPKPIKAVILPAEPEPEPESDPSEPSLSELPYRTRVDYKTDDDVLPVSHARADHVTTQPRSHTTSGQVISVTSPGLHDATRIQIGDHVDRDKRSPVHNEPQSRLSPTSSPRSRFDISPDSSGQQKTERVTAGSHSKHQQVRGGAGMGGRRQAQRAKGRSLSDESAAETTTSRKVRTVVYDDDDYEEDLNKASTKRTYSTVYTSAVPVSPQNKNVIAANPKRPLTTVDNEREIQRQMTNSPVAVPTGDKPYRTHLHIKARTTQSSTVAGSGRNRAGLNSDGQGKRRLAAVVSSSDQRGSDSETRRRDERVKFAEDTVVQTPDGRTIITDDRSHSRRSHSISGTLPARLRGRRSIPDFEQQRDVAAIDLPRVLRTSAQQRGGVQARPLSAVFDDDVNSNSVVVKTGSVPSAINVLHRGNSAAAAVGNKSRKVVAITQPSPRRVAADVNYHRDAATVGFHRR